MCMYVYIPERFQQVILLNATRHLCCSGFAHILHHMRDITHSNVCEHSNAFEHSGECVRTLDSYVTWPIPMSAPVVRWICTRTTFISPK